MIKKYNEFINEGVMSKMWRELDGTEERDEEKEIHVDIDIEGVNEHHSFTDANGKFHKNGYLIQDVGDEKTKVNILKKTIRKIIEVRGEECSLNDIDVSNLNSIGFLFSCDFGVSDFNGDISGWDVSNIINFSNLFSKNKKFNGKNCSFENWKICADKNKDVSMRNMFEDVNFDNNVEIGISNWDMRRVSDMSRMFANSNFDGDLSNWDVSNCKDFSLMFLSSSYSGKNGSIKDWKFYDGREKFINFDSMFKKSSFNDNISNWNAKYILNIFSMFNECSIPEEYKPKWARWL